MAWLLLVLGSAAASSQPAGSPACASNGACAALLLLGNCCPTDEGVTLECCSGSSLQSAASPPALPEPPSAPCVPPASPEPPAISPVPPSPPAPPVSPGVSLLDGRPPLGGSDHGGFQRASPHPQQPSKAWSGKTAPLPTNRWWINLVLANGDNVVSPLPYIVKALADGLHVSLPEKEATATYVTLPFADTLVFGATEISATSDSTPTIIDFDDLSVTLSWAAESLRTPLVRGMPFVTAVYARVTPVVTFAASPIESINGKIPDSAVVHAARFELELANGQMWILYADSAIDAVVSGTALRFTGVYTGMLRGAVVTSASVGILDAHAKRVATGGRVESHAYGDHATVTFHFEAQGAGDLLMMALPHHTDEGHLTGVTHTSLRYSTLKGEMRGVLGDTWTVDETLPPIEWGAARPIEPSQRAAIRTALDADKDKSLLVTDPYGSGKEMGAVARLALIADELGEEATAKALRQKLADKLEVWLSGNGDDPLQYEPTYGGLVSKNGLADRASDFGGGWYNDHHFHYGYFLYAAAAVGRKDTVWLHKWAPAISHLVRDIANPSRGDPLYTTSRFKDWYVGHSWASGLFPSASGRNQESVSEALNAWYGLALYGVALGDASLRDLGRVMLATELRSGWRYWQIDPHHAIYPQEFAANGLAAVVWSTKVDKTTWFGSNVEYSYGIQTMPVTPITELWLRPEWVAATHNVWGPAVDSAAEQWRGILLMMSAVIAPDDAWRRAGKLALFDNGNSRTNVLYWIATRPQQANTALSSNLFTEATPAIHAVTPVPVSLMLVMLCIAIGALLAAAYLATKRQSARRPPSTCLGDLETVYHRF